jgi:hypothetical protein
MGPLSLAAASGTNGNGTTGASITPRPAIASALGEPEKPPRSVSQQLSYSGTPRLSDGSAWPDEYSPDLREPHKRMEIFEEMGNDDAIAAAITARVQDINAANWLVQTDDDSDLGQEIKAFIEDNLYPVLDQLLRWLGGGPIQYGFGLIEPVFEWSDGPFVASVTRGTVTRPTSSLGRRLLYLRRLAHIRQPAIYHFKIAETGELTYAHQYVFNGVDIRDVEIPAEKLLIRVYDRQGDDYYGNPPMRKVYKAWMLKKQFERLAVLHVDRFGVGVPTLTEPPGGLTPTDRALWMAMATKWRSGAESGLAIPNGSKVDIVTGQSGTLGESLNWTKFWNLQVAKAFSTQQTELGSTQTGSRAVGQTFDEQRQGVIQADCEDIASVINNLLIVPLVKWNYGEQKTYPAFNPSQRTKANKGAAADIVSLTTAGYLHPTPADEVHVRDMLEMPERPEEELKEEADQRKQDAQKIADAAVKAGAAAQQDNPTKPPTGRPPLRIAATRDASNAIALQLGATPADGAPPPAVPGESTYRTPDYSAWEQEILRPDILMRDLDLHASQLTGEVKAVLDAIDADLTRQGEAAAADGAQALRDAIPRITVSGRLRNRLRAVLLVAAQRSRDYGEQAVRNEIERQLGPSGVGPQRSPRFPSLYPSAQGASAYTRFSRFALAQQASDEPTPVRDLQLEAEVDRIVEDEIDRREGSARAALATALQQAGSAALETLVAVVIAALKSALAGLSTARTQSNVQSVVNVGFGVGRSDQADAINEAAGAAPELDTADEAEPSALPSSDPQALPSSAPPGGGRGGRSGLVDAQGEPIELVGWYYSAVMDLGTCDECAKWDGAFFPIEYPDDYTGVQCPNPRCEGTYAKCRCVKIFVTDKEAPATVGPSKGPVPLA